jgi:hypothetical protein
MTRSFALNLFRRSELLRDYRTEFTRESSAGATFGFVGMKTVLQLSCGGQGAVESESPALNGQSLPWP